MNAGDVFLCICIGFVALAVGIPFLIFVVKVMEDCFVGQQELSEREYIDAELLRGLSDKQTAAIIEAIKNKK